MYYINNKISYCSNDNTNFALSFNKCFNKSFNEIINKLTILSKLGNIVDVFETGNFEYQSNFVSKNIEDTVLESEILNISSILHL